MREVVEIVGVMRERVDADRAGTLLKKLMQIRAPHRAFQRMSLKQDRVRHDLQTRRDCRRKLASPQWPQPVAENHPRYKVHRRNRGCQIASSNRCRLIPSVTKIR